MAISKKAYRGCRDLFPPDKRKLEYIFAKIRSVCESFGYEPYDGPLLESLELYHAKSGEELVNEQLYSFTDRGNREVAIRPEMTPTLARMVSQVHREIAKPIRWYSIPNLMRYEKPQRGRLREHWQFNCDIFGAPGSFGELETLQLLITLLKSFGATPKQFSIQINDRAIVEALFNKVLKIDEAHSYKLYKIIDKSKKVSKDALKKMIAVDFDSNQMRIIFDYLQADSMEKLPSFLNKYEISDSAQGLANVFEKLSSTGISDFLNYDPAIVRGLDYYTGIVFEAFDLHPDNRRAICGGGSYANLLQIFNETPLAGVGFGLGDVTLSDFLETHGLLPDFSTPPTDIILTFQDDELLDYALKVNHLLRQELKQNIEFHPTSIKVKKVFSIAQKKGISKAIFIGSRESENNTISFKNLDTKESTEISLTNIQTLK